MMVVHNLYCVPGMNLGFQKGGANRDIYTYVAKKNDTW